MAATFWGRYMSVDDLGQRYTSLLTYCLTSRTRKKKSCIVTESRSPLTASPVTFHSRFSEVVEGWQGR